MFESIGPHMWAVLACLGFMLVGAFLVNRGVLGAIIGVLVSAAATGALVDIVFYEGTVFPGIGLPIGVVAALAVLAIGGANLAMNSRNTSSGSGSGGNFRDRVPQFETKQVAAVVIGSVFVLVAFVTLVGRLDFGTTNTSAGFVIASDEFDRQSDAALRRIERFLAR